MQPWNKGKTKYTNKSVLKISKTLSQKARSNFWEWQRLNKPQYKKIKIGKDFAELFGTMLGDGCIEKLKRTEKLTISFNRKEINHKNHVYKILTRLFDKKPSTRIRKEAKCDDLYLYQKFLSKRLSFPCGKKLNHKLYIPNWIKNSKIYVKHCLKGLFETDGDWVIDNKYKTNVIKFSNRSDSLLDDLADLLRKFGYHPQRRRIDVRLARKKEVYQFVKWIKFRQYSRVS